MPNNDPASDRYNPPSVQADDFTKLKFDDVPEQELFWTGVKVNGINQIYKKTSRTQAINVKTRETSEFNILDEVFQRT